MNIESMTKLFTQIVSVYIAGITGLYKGVPMGFALQSSPVVTATFTALGSITVVLVIFFSGKPLKNWIKNKLNSKAEKKEGLFTRIMNQYGIVGLGLIAPGIMGPIVTSILGLIFIKNTGKFLVFLITGIIIWSVLLTLIGYVSIDLVKNTGLF
jgi:membrane protein DedA with SNARE-associated domain